MLTQRTVLLLRAPGSVIVYATVMVHRFRRRHATAYQAHREENQWQRQTTAEAIESRRERRREQRSVEARGRRSGEAGDGIFDRAKADGALFGFGEAPGRVGKSRWGLGPPRRPRPYIIPSSSLPMSLAAL